jgi:ATP adenylyltransferase
MSTLANPAYSPRTRGAHADACKFCDVVTSSARRVFGTIAVLDDAYPVTPGHALIVPLRHVTDYFSMTREEKIDLDRALVALHKEIQSSDRSVVGFNIGTNIGTAAGQTVQHAHIHLIPRREGDTPRPRGGVRGVIPEKMDY